MNTDEVGLMMGEEELCFRICWVQVTYEISKGRCPVKGYTGRILEEFRREVPKVRGTRLYHWPGEWLGEPRKCV